MAKFITENDFTNRKVKYQSYVTGIVTFIMTFIAMLKLVNPKMAESLNVDEGTLIALGMAIAGGAAAVMALISWIAGYFTHPGPGDGIKEKTD